MLSKDKKQELLTPDSQSLRLIRQELLTLRNLERKWAEKKIKQKWTKTIMKGENAALIQNIISIKETPHTTLSRNTCKLFPLPGALLPQVPAQPTPLSASQWGLLWPHYDSLLIPLNVLLLFHWIYHIKYNTVSYSVYKGRPQKTEIYS